MSKNNKFIDPMESLYCPPPDRTKCEAFAHFLYDADEGRIMGRTPAMWLRVFIFYMVFYACLAVFFAICVWGLLQSVNRDTPTYVLDRSIIGDSSGLASRPLPSEGRESVLTYWQKNKTWTNVEGLTLLEEFLKEYQAPTNNTQACDYVTERPDDNVVCEVDIEDWGACKPNGTALNSICLYFKLNKVFEWLPDYYKSIESIPSHMPNYLREEIESTLQSEPEKKWNKVWLSCEGRHAEDKTRLGNITFYPEQGFPGYFYPFRNQHGFRSPVVAMHIINPIPNEEINLECRAWASNIEQDRKEQFGVLNYKIKIQ